MSDYPFFKRQQLIWEFEGSTTQKMYLLTLNQFLGANNCCWPTVKTIQKYSRMSDSTVRRTGRELQASGIIAKLPQYKDNQCTGNKYEIHWERLTSPPVNMTPPVRETVPPLSEKQDPPVTVTDRTIHRTVQVGTDHLFNKPEKTKPKWNAWKTERAEEVVRIWNELRPKNFTKVPWLDPGILRKVDECFEDMRAEQASEVVRKALMSAHLDSFLINPEHKFDITTALSKGRIFAWARRAESFDFTGLADAVREAEACARDRGLTGRRYKGAVITGINHLTGIPEQKIEELIKNGQVQTSFYSTENTLSTQVV